MTSARSSGHAYIVGQRVDYNEWILDQEGVQGWFDGAGVDIDATERPNQWGDFSERPRATSRLIALSGTAIAESPEALQEMRDSMASLFSVDKYGEISVSNSAGTRTASVCQEGKVSWEQVFDNVASFRLELYAPDPRMYGVYQQVQIEDATISGGLKYALTYPLNFNIPPKQTLQYITNNGSVQSWPIFAITGDFPSGFTVSDSGTRRVTFTGSVTMKSPVYIDMGKGVALQNGIDVSVSISERKWISIPPKSTIRPSFSPKQDGAGWCDIIYRDTWI